MTPLRDAERIAALMDAASQQHRPLDPGSGRAARWLRTVDFRRPTKFTTEQERRLSESIETFCRAAATRLTAERVPIELQLLDVSQLTWSNAHVRVPEGSLVALLGTRPLGTRLVLSAEQTLLLGALDCLLGGGSERAPRDRKLTDIDLLLVRRVFEALTEALSGVLRDAAGVELQVNGIDPAGESAHLELPSEATLVVTLEARLPARSGTVILFLPHKAVEPVLPRFPVL